MIKSVTFEEFIKEAHDHQKGKVCIKCKEHKLLTEFNKHKKAKDGRRTECRECSIKYINNMCKFKRWFTGKKGHSKEKGKEFLIEPTDIPGVKIKETITIDRLGRKHKSWEAIEYPKVCSVLGMELDWGMNGNQPNSPSLDREDSTKGYVPGNVVMMSTKANRMKQDASAEELILFSEFMLSKYKD